MMQLFTSVRDVLGQITHALSRLSSEQYNYPCRVLSGATIGQHVRHVAELFVCLEKGYANGIINYDRRDRNRQIETDPVFALGLLHHIEHTIERPDKFLYLETGYTANETGTSQTATNYHREVLYNLEHTVHHMALIRIGIESLAIMSLPDSFGVAASTIQYRASCAQ
jgi:hypothetical protein